MIKVFGETDKDFTSNGDAVIQPFKTKVHKENNGKFYLLLMLYHTLVHKYIACMVEDCKHKVTSYFSTSEACCTD